MTSMKRLASGAALTALVCAMSSAVYAQETTAAIRGQIVDTQGAPVAGATVTITHVPTGASSTTVTGLDGIYSARGLRVGGPYRIAATAPQFEAGASTLQSVGVGDAAQVDVRLGRTGDAQVAELVVTAAAGVPSQGGPSSNFTAADIDSLPSISRDLKDVARLDPFATIDPTNSDAISFGGVNTRFNQLTVDGIRQNDDFGLNNNGYPTQRSPISIDAIEAVNVSSAPYSVINNGFLGGQINAVTKSGGNTFSGSAFYEYSDNDLRGDTANGVDYSTVFEEKTWGATLGGPIIKDRLFFFGAYEKFEGLLGFDTGPVGSGAAVIIPRISADAVETFRQTTQSLYGYDPGSYLNGAFPVEDEKYLAKLDLVITDDHRASLTYQQTTGNSLNGSVNSVFANGNSTTQPRVGLASNQYDKTEELITYSAQLNSDWTENFSTELRYSNKETDTTQMPLSGLSVGQVVVGVGDLPGVATGTGTPQIQFGADTFRHDNYLNVKTETFEAIGRYSMGDHDFLFGARTEQNDIINVFVSNSLGSYTFASYADFLARRASGFSLSGGVDPTAGTVPATIGTARLGAATFGYRLTSLYGEDRLQITPTLDVTAGVRYDRYSMDDTPSENAAFFSRHGFSNTSTLDGKDAVLPRVSFNWEPRTDLTISGGIGRFSSTGLNVWISNAYSNNGVNQTNAVCPAGPYTNVDLTKAPAGCTFTPGNGNVNAIDPSLQIPTAWKGNLTATYEADFGRFGDSWRFTAAYLKSVNENALIWYNLRSVQTGVAPDGRPVYSQSTAGNTVGNQNDFLLTNTSKGASESIAFVVDKAWREGLWDGLSVSLGYTHTDAEDANPMTSSIAQSSYTRYGTSNPQNPAAATSDYEVSDRWTMNFGYSRAFFGDNETSVQVFAQNRTGLPFSYTFANSRSSGFDNDFGYNVSSYSGRQASSNALFYVPQMSGGSITATSDPIVQYATGFDVSAFDAFVKSSGLSAYAGGIAPRNAFNTPDVTTVDLRLSQELPAFFPGGAKLQVYMDVENLGNLLNDEWGVLEQYDFHRSVPVATVSCVAAGTTTATSCGAPNAAYLYSGNASAIDPYVVPSASLWQVKFGVKYKF